MKAVRGTVSGRVQGVGFRWFVEGLASRLGVAGWVRNLPDGRVEFFLQGSDDLVDRMLAEIRRGPRSARVDDLRVEPAGFDAKLNGFVIR